MNRQQGKQRGRLGAGQPDPASIAYHLDRAQKPHLQAGDGTPALEHRRTLTGHTHILAQLPAGST
jgi:hypothetical protein